MGFDRFIEQAWQDHADHTEAVAERLAEVPRRITTPAQVAPLARLVLHVFGEHLGRWQDGQRLLEALRDHVRDDAAAASALRVGHAALALAQGGAAPGLDTEERIATLACASAIGLGRNELARASSWFLQAIDLAATEPVRPRRALAVAANNLACAVGELPERTPEQRRTMLAAAHAARVEWERAGTWLETERAEYVLAKSYLKAGDAAAAQRHATQCLEICEHHQAPAFERFFAHEALGHAAHAGGDRLAFEAALSSTQTQFDALSADDRTACGADLQALKGLPRA